MVDLTHEFPILRDRIFFDHAAVAPLPARSAAALDAWRSEALTDVGGAWPQWAKSLGRARANAAKLVAASPDDIAFVHNTTHGLLCVANSLPWKPGDNILVPEGEFPANVHPWRNLAPRGVAVRTVPERDYRFEVSDFTDLMDSRTRLVATSTVQYSTGFRMPVEDIAAECRKRNILLCVDAIQGLGAMPTQVEDLGCDFLVADGHKWLLSAEGFGVLYARSSARERMNDSMTGWTGRLVPGAYEDLDQALSPKAKRFEEGSHAMALAAIFEKSTELLLEVGMPEVWAGIEALTAALTEGLGRLGVKTIPTRADGERSGIVAAIIDGVDRADLVRSLQEENIFVAQRRGCIRISPHFYNNEAQIEEFLAVLGRELKARA